MLFILKAVRAQANLRAVLAQLPEAPRGGQEKAASFAGSACRRVTGMPLLFPHFGAEPVPVWLD
jgi:hypothetical protein